LAERDFRLIDFDYAPRVTIRVDHRSAQFLGQQPRGFVSNAELILQLSRRHAVGIGRHQMCRPEQRRRRQLGPMHHCSRRGRGLSVAIKAFACVSATLQRRRALRATAGTKKTAGPTPLEQQSRAARLVGKHFLRMRKRWALAIARPVADAPNGDSTIPQYHSESELGQRDKPQWSFEMTDQRWSGS
jgi:hypothetical protein